MQLRCSSYTHATNVWALSIVHRPVPNPTRPIRTKHITLYTDGARTSLLFSAVQGDTADEAARCASSALLLSTPTCWVDARCLTTTSTPSPHAHPTQWEATLTAAVPVERLCPPQHAHRLVVDVSLLFERGGSHSPGPPPPSTALTLWLGAVEVRGPAVTSWCSYPTDPVYTLLSGC